MFFYILFLRTSVHPSHPSLVTFSLSLFYHIMAARVTAYRGGVLRAEMTRAKREGQRHQFGGSYVGNARAEELSMNAQVSR